MNLKFKCRMCFGSAGMLSCQSSGLANLKKHVERKHATRLKEFEDLLKGKKSGRVQQPTISVFCSSGSPMQVSQHVINNQITKFIVNTGQAFSIVRHESFRDLVETLQPGKKVPCYQTLMRLTTEKYTEMRDEIKNHFANSKHVCTTADAWSEANKSYLGVTAHTLDEEGKRKSFAIACRRLKGRHTYDILAEALENIHAEYNIQFKVLGTVTDNGSNFCKAFKLFGEVETQDSGMEEDGDDTLVFQGISDILEEDEEVLHHLPRHHRCAAHTINLVATKDSEEALKTPAFAKLSRSVFAKCQGLWNKQGRTTQFADLVHEKFKLYFLVPNSTRWNSVFYSMERVQKFLQISTENMNTLLAELGIAPFTAVETTFIKEYCDLMKPVAQALDILQGDKHAYLGYLLPTISLLKKKLQEKGSSMQYCKHLADALCRGLDKRFQGQFDDRRALLSAVSTPAFRLGWMDSEVDKERGRKLLWDEMKVYEDGNQESHDNWDETEEDGFFPKRPKVRSTSGDELSRFLNDPSVDTACLKQYPLVCQVCKKLNSSIASTWALLHFFVLQVFRKYNTLFPSSASCERLFSHGKNLFRRNRHGMKDSTFEMQLLLHVNNVWK